MSNSFTEPVQILDIIPGSVCCFAATRPEFPLEGPEAPYEFWPKQAGIDELLATARWLHQRDANAKTVIWATTLVLGMATLMAALLGAMLGSLFHHTLAGLVLATSIPLAHTLKTLIQRRLRYHQAQRALSKTDPTLIATVQQYHAELLTHGTRYEIRTSRKIQTLHVLQKDEVTLVHLDYPEWFLRDDPRVESLVKKARPC